MVSCRNGISPFCQQRLVYPHNRSTFFLRYTLFHVIVVRRNILCSVLLSFSQEPEACVRTDKQLFRYKDVGATEQRFLSGTQPARVCRSRGVLPGRDNVQLQLQLLPYR